MVMISWVDKMIDKMESCSLSLHVEYPFRYHRSPDREFNLRCIQDTSNERVSKLISRVLQNQKKFSLMTEKEDFLIA